jgi:hypothetical protein
LYAYGIQAELAEENGSTTEARRPTHSPLALA